MIWLIPRVYLSTCPPAPSILSISLFVILLAAFHQLISKNELTILLGLVKGKDGGPRSYVKVELSGPENKTIYTKKDGTFKVELASGTYVLTITEKSRNMSFEVTIEKGIENSFTFPLSW